MALQASQGKGVYRRAVRQCTSHSGTTKAGAATHIHSSTEGCGASRTRPTSHNDNNLSII